MHLSLHDFPFFLINYHLIMLYGNGLLPCYSLHLQIPCPLGPPWTLHNQWSWSCCPSNYQPCQRSREPKLGWSWEDTLQIIVIQTSSISHRAYRMKANSLIIKQLRSLKKEFIAYVKLYSHMARWKTIKFSFDTNYLEILV